MELDRKLEQKKMEQRKKIEDSGETDTSDLDISVPADSSEPEGEISSSVGDVSERDLPESVKLSPKNPSVSADSIEKEQENE